MNINAKIFNKILTNQIQHHINMHHVKVDFHGCKSGSTYVSLIIHHIERIKDKNQAISSLDEEKTFDEIQHPFLRKTEVN